MPLAASPLSLAAAGFYLLVISSTGLAAARARRFGQQDWHALRWLLLAALFGLLTVMRLADAEELLRDVLRDELRASQDYAVRREFQRPLAAGVIAFAGASLWWAARWTRSIKGRRNFAVAAGSAAGLGMVLLVLLRLISLHPVDTLLYGTLKLNWLADLGLASVVAGAAAWYARLVRARP